MNQSVVEFGAKPTSPAGAGQNIQYNNNGKFGASTVVKAKLEAVAAQAPIWTEFTPVLSFTGGTGNTLPTYTYSYGIYKEDPYGVDFFVTFQNSGGGTPGAGTGIFTLSLPNDISASSQYVNAPVIVGVAYENSITFTNWDVLCFLNSSDQELYMYKRASSTALSNLTGADQSGATRSITIKFRLDT